MKPVKAKPIEPTNFIEVEINKDIEAGKVKNFIQTRLPPEPNGYLHIGHAKNILINCGTAKKYGGVCNLRFDDTNPTREKQEFVDSIKEDIHWLGYDFANEYYASSYFDMNYEMAEKFIRDGIAYVDDLSKDEMREYRGTLKESGKNSPYRDRSVEENIRLFREMRDGKYEEGTKVLRAKIDMSSPNINMRDPAMYRIKFATHHQTGDKWCIYPMYDFSHPLDDAYEGVTHSCCDLFYEDHRPLYDWVVDHSGIENKPRQIEYQKIFIKNVVLGKRDIKKLVEEGYVDGWDDPRLFTLKGLRRRGYTADAILDFLKRAGISKADNLVDPMLLDSCLREDLKLKTNRLMAVVDPIKLVITNYDGEEDLTIENSGDVPEFGTRTVKFGKELFIEREDFEAVPPPKFFRLKPDGEVRLKGAYIIKYQSHETDKDGKVTTVYATYDKETKSGECERKVKGTIHWLNQKDCVPCEFRYFEMLTKENTDDLEIVERLNPTSKVVKNGYVEKACSFTPETKYQFIRLGYYCVDKDTNPNKLVINRIVGLKDSYKKD